MSMFHWIKQKLRHSTVSMTRRSVCKIGFFFWRLSAKRTSLCLNIVPSLTIIHSFNFFCSHYSASQSGTGTNTTSLVLFLAQHLVTDTNEGVHYAQYSWGIHAGVPDRKPMAAHRTLLNIIFENTPLKLHIQRNLPSSFPRGHSRLRGCVMAAADNSECLHDYICLQKCKISFKIILYKLCP